MLGLVRSTVNGVMLLSFLSDVVLWVLAMTSVFLVVSFCITVSLMFLLVFVMTVTFLFSSRSMLWMLVLIRSASASRWVVPCWSC